MANTKMKALNRTEKKYGKLLGWSKGLHGDSKDLLDAKHARKQVTVLLCCLFSDWVSI